MYEDYSSDDNSDPLFANEEKKTLAAAKTKLCNDIDDFINSIPQDFDGRTELIKRIDIVCQELNRLTQYAVNNTGAFPRITKDVRWHQTKSYEEILEIL